MEKIVISFEPVDGDSVVKIIAFGVTEALPFKVNGSALPAISFPATGKAPEPEVVVKPEPEPQAKPELTPTGRVKKVSYTQKIKAWDLYDFAVQVYGKSDKTFTSRELKSQWASWGREGSSSISSHLHRFAQVGLIKRVGGSYGSGWEWAIDKIVNRRELDSLYAKRKEVPQSARQRLARKFGGSKW